MSDCQHVLLKKKLSGEQFWYQCDACRQKFKVELWDGKIRVIPQILENQGVINE